MKLWRTPFDQAEKATKPSKVVINKDRCKGCSYCIDFCPAHCLAFSQEYNQKGYHFPTLARPEDCTGCDLCGLYCPDFAIFITEKEKIVAEVKHAQG